MLIKTTQLNYVKTIGKRATPESLHAWITLQPVSCKP